MIDWEAEISRMKLAKRTVEAADQAHLWRVEPPRDPAAPQALREMERVVGRPLDQEYLNFLLHADGWPAFLQDIDLFGASDIGSEVLDQAREVVQCLDPGVLVSSGVDPGTALPIGLSRTDIDVFVMLENDLNGFAPILWIAGVEVERYVGFQAFFDAMISENAEEAEAMRNG
jgi:hypothetical protein